MPLGADLINFENNLRKYIKFVFKTKFLRVLIFSRKVLPDMPKTRTIRKS